MKKNLLTIAAVYAMLWQCAPVLANEGVNFDYTGWKAGSEARQYEVLDNIDDAFTTLVVSPTPGDDSVTSAKIVNGAILNADINASAAIAFSKLAGLADGYLLVGSVGNVPVAVALSGDATILNTGAISVSDLTISGEAQGEVLYYNGSNWVSLNVGTSGYALLTAGAGQNPYWGIPPVAQATTAAQSLTIEAGTNDVTLATTTQTVGAVNLTIPDFANTDSTMAVLELAQTFTAAQTFSNTGVHILDTNASHDLVIIPGSNITADRNFTITTGDAARTLTMAGDINVSGNLSTVGNDNLILNTSAATEITLPTTGTLATLAGSEAITNKSLADDNVYFGDSAALTKKLEFELTGATVGKTATIISSHTDDRVITLPDATDTLVGKATTDALTNKTIDADGTGNVISNINANELDPIAVGNYGVPFVLTYSLTNQGAAVNIYNANAPFKFLITNVHSISTSADGGTWKLNNGAAGAGTDITNAVTVATSADDIDVPTDITYAEADIAANGSLSIVPDGGGLLDAIIIIECIRIN
jgi:fructose-specific component phosphotransferase system IIB-like protein